MEDILTVNAAGRRPNLHMCTNRCAINDLIASNQSSFGSQLDLLCICFQVQFVSVCVFVVCASSFPPGEMLTLQHMVCYNICSKDAP